MAVCIELNCRVQDALNSDLLVDPLGFALASCF